MAATVQAADRLMAMHLVLAAEIILAITEALVGIQAALADKVPAMWAPRGREILAHLVMKETLAATVQAADRLVAMHLVLTAEIILAITKTLVATQAALVDKIPAIRVPIGREKILIHLVATVTQQDRAARAPISLTIMSM